MKQRYEWMVRHTDELGLPTDNWMTPTGSWTPDPQYAAQMTREHAERRAHDYRDYAAMRGLPEGAEATTDTRPATEIAKEAEEWH